MKSNDLARPDSPSSGASQPLPEIRALTGIRGIASLWVVLFHFGEKLSSILPEFEILRPIYEKGHIGVDLFFILSGFIITSVYSRQTQWDRANTLRFINRRFARIYPVHLVTLLALAALIGIAQALDRSVDGAYGLSEFAAHVFLLHAFPIVDSAWNYPSWSISAEFFAYTVVYPLTVLSFRMRQISQRGFEIALGLLVTLVALRATGALESWGYIFSVTLEFFAGAALFRGLQNNPSLKLRLNRSLPTLLLTALLVCYMPTSILPTDYGRYALVFFCLALIGGLSMDRGEVCQFLGSGAMCYLGRISYSLYMGHALVEKVFKSLLPASQFADSGPALKIAIIGAHIVAPVVLAIALYHLVEEPARRLLTRKR